MDRLYKIWINGHAFYFTAERPLSKQDIEKLESIAEDMRECTASETSKTEAYDIFRKFMKTYPAGKLKEIKLRHVFHIR